MWIVIRKQESYNDADEITADILTKPPAIPTTHNTDIVAMFQVDEIGAREDITTEFLIEELKHRLDQGKP